MFSKEDVFTVRCLVWWGNEVSIHFLIKGKYYEQYAQNVETNLKELPLRFFQCIAASPWEHHFESNNYVPLFGIPKVEFDL